MSKSRSLSLVEKSTDCIVSAIEMYNKPDFRYREEVFCILVINAWELLLKAKVLKDNNNKLNSIYVKEYPKNKNGEKGRKMKYRLTRSGNNFTVDIFNILKRLRDRQEIDATCYENIEALVEIRDNSVHFINSDALLSQKIQELGMATILSYITYIYDWFSISLEKYNFYLMPLSFFHPDKYIPVPLGNREKTINNVLQYIHNKEESFPSDNSKRHNITVAIETRVVKASKMTDAQKISITSDPSAPQVQIGFEDITKTHPMEYKELTAKLKKRYSNFVVNSEYHEQRKILEADQRFCIRYPQNPKNPNGASKKMYGVAIFSEFDKYYTKDEGMGGKK
jgi:Protein of unknown function (DUF3644).